MVFKIRYIKIFYFHSDLKKLIMEYLKGYIFLNIWKYLGSYGAWNDDLKKYENQNI